ncbi:hypothetical protein M378DRAFT_71427 [Amanita muscaria Koide BX008]|uniref:M-phase inducer phosphatase n=1 Tax=Amanita muscaria (strain Koide BX008) TaxID=946122 RepID=A0A0C2XHZ6_AMAMK|nr:hypothetical protein M378DRAFT_71427 [Amanita muscaria Koide BX008]
MSFLDRLIESARSSYKVRPFIDLDLEQEMAFFNPSSTHLAPPPAPSRKRSQRFSKPLREEVDAFLSSDLEVSFASNVSLNSPSRDNVFLPQDNSSCIEPMDISPLPTRPRAYTSGARLFGNNIGNTLDLSPQPASKSSNLPSTQANGKRTQRSALPLEWMLQPASPNPLEAQPTNETFSTDDAMDVDTSFAAETNAFLSSSPLGHSTTPTATTFNNLFFDSMSPRRSLDSPSGPATKKRRSLSPENVRLTTHDNSSSPSLVSSPSQNKVDRMSGTNLFSRLSKDKPMLEGLGNPPTNQSKRPRKPVLSAMILPSEMQTIQSAYPVPHSEDRSDESLNPVATSPPVRRAFSALIPPSMYPDAYSDESSIDGPDMSSPAQAYTRRQQVRTLRRRDGTEDFRPLTGASPLYNRDSPSAKFLAPGLPGFGDNEAHGKVLPCHKVREDGLMRINCKTLDDLLVGKYDSRIANFIVIDCRFDYEYNGGHIPGAINVNTTTGVEELLLGPNWQKPKPSVSGDSVGKTVLVFHCEFSAKRAPTFAKHLRAKDRATNNHFYPKIYYPEIYILEGGYCQYFKTSPHRCEPPAYVRMDDPKHLASRREDLDQFRKVKFGRHKSYAFGELGGKTALQPPAKRNTAPIGANSMFAAANAARTRRSGSGGGSTLMPLPEDTDAAGDADDTDTDIGDSPCPPPNRTSALKGKKLGRAPLTRAETYGPIRMPF